MVFQRPLCTLVVLCSLIFCCSLPAHRVFAQSAAPAPSANATLSGFEGRWLTTYGPLLVDVDGDKATGSYVYGNGSGTIEGTITNNILTFRYIESDGTEGDGIFTLNQGGMRFDGKWHPDGQTQWQPWNGTRDPATPISLPSSVSSRFEGLFKTNYGPLQLTQEADRVTGHYRGASVGTLEGTIKQGRLHYTYTETSASGEGWFELSDDGMHLQGQWRAKGGSTFKPWTGSRVVPKPGVRWLIIFETHWEHSITEQEYSFGDMLRSYFKRIPHVQVRQRRIADKVDFLRAGAELAYLAEPVVVLLSGHGSPEGLQLAGEFLSEAEIIEVLRPAAHNIELLHFSSCNILAGEIPQRIRAALPKETRPVISGYAKVVDWSASAVFEMLYLDLVVGRRMTPQQAAEIVTREMNFADDTSTEGSPFGSLSFRILAD